MNRLLLTETMDPNGAMYRWCSPDVEALGWDVLRIPTQESIHHLGIEAYNANLRGLIRYWRPHIFMVHPPYDFLLPGTVAAAKKVGTRLVGFGFDDALFMADLAEKGALTRWARDVEDAFDLYTSTDSASVQLLQDHGMERARNLRFATCPAPFEVRSDWAPPKSALEGTAVLVGRAYEGRVKLVDELLRRNVPVSVFGHGWMDVGETPEGLILHGPLEREAMNAVYATAGVVVTTGNWENHAIPMVKYRLLEVAMVGGFQIAQACANLDDYFPADVVPTYSGVSDLAESISRMLDLPKRRAFMARAAQAHAMRDHRWKHRFPELLDHLKEVGRAPREERVETSPAGYRSQLMFLGHLHENSGNKRLAHELFSEVARRFPTDVAARHALARAASRREDREGEVEEILAARSASAKSNPITSRGVFMYMPRGHRPLGLGESAYLHPDAELNARALVALTQAGRPDEAMEIVDELSDPDLIVAVASLLTVPRLPTSPQLWLRLVSRAMEVPAVQLRDLQAEQTASWKDEADRLKAQIASS